MKRQKGTKKKHRINQKIRFKMAINTYQSIITLNVSELNIPVKRQSVRLDNKTRTYSMLPTKDPLQGEGCTKIESERMEKDTSCKQNDRKAEVTILISDKI